MRIRDVAITSGSEKGKVQPKKNSTKSADSLKSRGNKKKGRLFTLGSEVTEFAARKKGKMEHNFGDKMYQTAMIKKKQKEKIADEKRRDREIEELKSATFKPEINHVPRPFYFENFKMKADERLYHLASVAQEKMQKAMASSFLRDLEECTFHPKIDNK